MLPADLCHHVRDGQFDLVWPKLLQQYFPRSEGYIVITFHDYGGLDDGDVNRWLVTQGPEHQFSACFLFTSTRDYYTDPSHPMPNRDNGNLYGDKIPHVHAFANMLEVEETFVKFWLGPKYLSYETGLRSTIDPGSERSRYRDTLAEYDFSLPNICNETGFGILADAVQQAYRRCPPASSQVPRPGPLHDVIIRPEPKPSLYHEAKEPTNASEADYSPASPSASPSKRSKRSSRRISWKFFRPGTPSSH